MSCRLTLGQPVSSPRLKGQRAESHPQACRTAIVHCHPASHQSSRWPPQPRTLQLHLQWHQVPEILSQPGRRSGDARWPSHQGITAGLPACTTECCWQQPLWHPHSATPSVALATWQHARSEPTTPGKSIHEEVPCSLASPEHSIFRRQNAWDSWWQLQPHHQHPALQGCVDMLCSGEARLHGTRW